jgi:serine/threonine-protein kinase
MTQPRLLGGRYELDGVVGRGGMAEVYRARDIRLDRIVAIKTLRDDLARDPTFQARFRREAQSAASLNHPSIIAVYDTGEDMVGPLTVPYIVMEYVDGRTLRDLLRDDRRLLPERAVEIVDGVLRALDYSHRNGIVHRDIKPANVMLTRTGDVKVMDFGIARAMSDSQVTMTQTAQVIGTAQYLSPEQARGERVDARSDLYSTGCLLYELLTGRPPFTGDSPVAIAYQHVRENPIPPSHLDRELPRWADAIVLRAMAKSPADRYQSAADMRADIQRAMSGMPVSAIPVPMAPPTQGISRAGMAAPTSAIPGYQYGAQEGPPDGPPRRTGLWVVFGIVALAAVLVAAYFALAGSGGTKYAVPQVTGLTKLQAGQRIVANHLQPQFIDQNSQTVAQGKVISTDPSWGTMLPANSVVKVYVSAGQQKVPVPDVVGEDSNSAQSKLTNLNLNPSIKRDTKSTAPANTVVRQVPPAGTKVAPGTVVTLYVSGGGVNVQNVVGLDVNSAKALLEGQGFKVTIQQLPGPAGTPPNQVWQQQPGPGTPKATGSTVTIYVEPAGPTGSPTPTATGTPTGTATP